jgi:hypothetical protein
MEWRFNERLRLRDHQRHRSKHSGDGLELWGLRDIYSVGGLHSVERDYIVIRKYVPREGPLGRHTTRPTAPAAVVDKSQPNPRRADLGTREKIDFRLPGAQPRLCEAMPSAITQGCEGLVLKIRQNPYNNLLFSLEYLVSTCSTVSPSLPHTVIARLRPSK